MRRTTIAAAVALIVTATTAIAAESPIQQPPPSATGQSKMTPAMHGKHPSRLQLAKQRLAQMPSKPPSGDKLDRIMETARSRASSALDRMRNNGTLRDLMDRVAARQ